MSTSSERNFKFVRVVQSFKECVHSFGDGISGLPNFTEDLDIGDAATSGRRPSRLLRRAKKRERCPVSRVRVLLSQFEHRVS